MTMFEKLVILFASVSLGSGIELSSNGEYRKIVVRIDKGISSQHCQSLLQNLQRVLESTTEAVGVASTWRVWPAHYIIVLPSEWAELNCSTSTSLPKGNTRYLEENILVHDGPLVYGEEPFTVQPKGCEEEGGYISLPTHLLTSNSTSNLAQTGKVMAHQFFKLRFGIFDERGYPEDPLYPGHYKHQGRILPTGAANVPVKGVWLTREGTSPCRPDRESCIFHPQGENDQLTCSLGYLPTLPRVTSYCSPDEMLHQLAPTKHNVICSGKSAHDIIHGSEDYRLAGSSAIRSNVTRVPRIDLVVEDKEKIVLVMETSASMADEDDWKWIQKVAHKLLRYDLPGDVEVGVVSFSNVSKIESPLTLLHNARDLLADSVPDKYRLSQDNGRCVICGLNTALQDVLGDKKAGAHIVLFTRGGEDTLSFTDESRIKEFVQYYQIKLSTVIIPGEREAYRTFYDSTALMSGGRTVVVQGGANQQSTGVTKYMQMVTAINSILEQSLDKRIYNHQIHWISSTVQESCGFFLVPEIDMDDEVEEEVERQVQFGIIVQDEEDHLIRSVTFTDSEGSSWGPYRRIATTFDNINIKVLNFGLKNPPPFNQGGEWRYKIEWHVPPSGQTLEAGVLISALKQPTDVRVRFWTSSDISSDIVTSQHPLTMYVGVERGMSPVLHAKVFMSVKVMMANATVISLPPVQLADNGNGDPDMLGNDGIYSRYLTAYPGPGRYVFTVSVSENGNDTVYVTGSENLTERCCGSYLDFQPEELKPIKRMSEVFELPAINLLQVPSADDEDRMPPAKIGDLRIVVNDKTSSLKASWTAPGNDYDSGYVRGYKFLFSNSISQLLNPTSDPAVLHALDRSDQAGNEVCYEFDFEYFEEEYFVAIVAVDPSNNTGKMSNIVPVFMPALVVDTAPAAQDRSVDIALGPLDNDWTMIGALCGAILLLAIFLLLGILYFLKVAKPKKPITIPVHGKDDGTDNSSCSSDSKNTSSHRLMPDITTIAGTLPTFQAPPSSLPDSTPTYWSATQLLTEHEQRALNLSYSAIHGPMETIREEYIGYPEEFSDSSHDPGITNLGFSRNNNGTPVHGVFGAGSGSRLGADGSVRSGSYRLERASEDPNPELHSGASSNLSESVISVGSNLFRNMGGTGGGVVAPSDPDLDPIRYNIETEPVRYSTAVQTTAPSTIASLRQNRPRNVSLV